MLLSDAGANTSYLFHANGSAALRGDITPGAFPGAGKVTYSTPLAETRLIGDVNGDGVADIFVRSTTQAQSRTFGIVFGRTGPETTRSIQADLTFRYTLPPKVSSNAEPPDLTQVLLVDDTGGGRACYEID